MATALAFDDGREPFRHALRDSIKRIRDEVRRLEVTLHRTALGGFMLPGIYRGEVTRVVNGVVYLTVPNLAKGREFGPAEGLPGVVLAQGNRVLVGLLEGRPDDVAIIRLLP